MSSYVDERVVEMRFDNKKFETNVSKSMRTLDKLKEKLNFKNDGVKSFEAITEAANKVDFSGAEQGIHHLMKQFGVLDAFHLNMVQTWGKRLYDFAEKQAKALSVDQIAAGWSKYESKAGSVQTIMNSTGYSIDKVNGYLDKLMWYSDETSYSFSDMTNALGTMLAAGGDINKLIPMIEGMANATSFAGKGSAEFNRVLYNLNQSYSQGFLSLQDWKSVQLAGVNSKALIDTLIQTGEELGKIRKGEVSAANFTSTLAKKWADAEVMEKGFAKFAEATEEAYDMVKRGEVATATEAYERLSETMQGIAITSAKAAQEARSFGEAIGSVKDAVATKFMTIFEYVFGNYEQSKATWSQLANDLWEIFAGPFDDIIEMSGFDALTAGAKAAGVDIDKLKDKLVELAIQEGILTEEDAKAGDLFGELADKSWITQKLYADAVESMGVTNKKNVDELKKTWTEWQSLMYSEWVEDAGKELEELEQWQLNSLGLTREQAAEYGKAGNSFADYANEIRDANGEYSNLIEHINDPGEYRMGYTEIIRKAFAESSLSDLSASLDEAGMSLDDLESHLESVGLATGKVTKEMIAESGGLVESFQSGWLDRDTYVGALEEYAKEQAEAANKIYEGMNDTQKWWYNKLVVEEGKTIDKMAEWELNALGIKGKELMEYNERKKQIEDYIELVKSGAEVTDEMFAGLTERTGQSAIANSIKNLSDALASLTGLFGNVMDIIFPFSDEEKVQIIRNIAFGIEIFTSKLIISEEAAESVANALGTVWDIVKFLWGSLKPIRDAFAFIAKDALGQSVGYAKQLASWILSVLGSVHLWLEEDNRLVKATNKVADFFKGIYTVVNKFVSRLKAGNVNFETFRETLRSTYDLIKNQFNAVIQAVDPEGKLQSILDFLADKFRKIKKLISDITNGKFEKVDEFLDSIFKNKNNPKETVFEKISKWALNVKDTVSNAFRAVTDITTKVFGWFGSAAKWIWEMVNAYLGPEQADRIIDIVKSLLSLKWITQLRGVFKEITIIMKAVGLFGDFTEAFKKIALEYASVLGGLAKGVKRIGTGLELLGLAAFIYSIGKAFDLLQGFSFEKDWQSLVLVGAMLLMVAGFVLILKKINSTTSEIIAEDGTKKKKRSSALGGVLESVLAVALIAAAVLAMAFALKHIMEAVGTNPDELWPALTIILTVVGISAAAVAIIGASFKNVDTKGLAATLLMLPIAIGGILLITKMLGDYLQELFNEKLNKGQVPKWAYMLAAIVVVLGVLATIVWAINTLGDLKLNMGTAATIVGLGLLIYLVGVTVNKFTDTMSRNPAAAITGLVGIFAGMAAILWILKGFSGDTKVTFKAAGTIFAFGVVLAELAIIIGILSFLPTDKVLKTTLSLAAIMVAIGGAVWAVSKITKDTKLGGLVLMIVILAGIVISIIALDKMIGSAWTVLGYAITLAITLSALSGVMKIASNLTDRIKWSNILLTVTMLAAVAAIVGLTTHFVKDITKFAIIAGILVAALLAVALAMRLASEVTKVISWKAILNTVLMMGTVAASLAIVAYAFSKMKRVDMGTIGPMLIALGVGLAAIAAVAGLLSVIPLTLIGVIGAIALMVTVAGSIKTIAKAFDIFTGAIERLTPVLPDLGTNIKEMADALNDADFGGLTELVNAFTGGVESYTGLVGAIQALADAGAFAIVANALDPFANAVIKLSPHLPDLGSNITSFTKALKDADFDALRKVIQPFIKPLQSLGNGIKALAIAIGLAQIFPGIMDAIALSVSLASDIANAFDTVANGITIIVDAAIKAYDHLPGAGTAISEFSKNLQGTDWTQLESLFNVASLAIIPLIGLALAAVVLNGSIDGLGLQIANLAIGIDMFRQSIGMSSNLGPEFLSSITSAWPYMEAGTKALLNDQKKVIEDMDYSDVAETGGKKISALSQRIMSNLNPFNWEETSFNMMHDNIAQGLLGLLGIETNGKDPSDLLADAWHDAWNPEMPAEYTDIVGDWDKMLKAWGKRNQRDFKYSDVNDWADLLGIDPAVVESMMADAAEIAAKKIEVNGKEYFATEGFLRYLFSDPSSGEVFTPNEGFEGSTFDGYSSAEYAYYLNQLYLRYCDRQAEAASKAVEKGPSPEVEEKVDEVATDISEGAEEVIEEIDEEINDEVKKQLEEAERAKAAREQEARNQIALLDKDHRLSDSVINDIVQAYVDDIEMSSSTMTQQISAELEAASKRQGALANQTGLIIHSVLGDNIDIDNLVAAASTWTAENFETVVPDNIKAILQKAFGDNLSPEELLSRVKGASAQEWTDIIMNNLTDIVGSKMPEGGVKEWIEQFAGSLGIEGLDLNALFGAFDGHFVDSLPEDYFAGTDTKFTEAGNDAIGAFIEAMNSEDNTELLIEAANKLATTSTEPVKTELSTTSMIDVGSKAIIGVGQGITSKTVSAKTAAQRAKSAIMTALSMYNESISVGRNIVRGVEEGMLGTDITGTLRSIAHRWVTVLEDELGIASPAKETIPIGSFFMKGIQVGIMDEETGMFHTIDEIAASAVDHMAEAIMLANEIVSNAVDDQPTIKPLMDLSDIEDGAKRMNRLVNADTATRIQLSREAVPIEGSSNVQNGGSVVNYTQNNYSPKSLSRIEIYRQTKNQLATIKV